MQVIYPPVVQLDTRSFEAAVQRELARERRAAAVSKGSNHRWLPWLHPRLLGAPAPKADRVPC